MTTAEQTEPFVSLAINVLFYLDILSDLVGLSARHLSIQYIQWTAKNSYYYCSISCFLTKILHCAFLSCEAFSDHLNSQAMDFKLPHDILCCRAAHDNRRADGGLSDFLPDQNIILSTNSSEPWSTSARHSVSSVYSVDHEKIRVHSCPFVVPNKRLRCRHESMENACGILETFSKTVLQ